MLRNFSPIKILSLIVLVFLTDLFCISCKEQIAKPHFENKDTYKITIKFYDYANAPVYLFDFYGYESKRIDSARTNEKGIVTFIFKNSNYSGFYRVVPIKVFNNNEKSAFDIIFNKEDVDIELSTTEPIKTIKINKSYENEIYYKYLKKREAYIPKEKVLLGFLSLYPKDDPWYKETEKYFNKIIIEYDEFLNEIKQEHFSSLACKFINAQQPVKYADDMPDVVYKTYMKTHFFDNISFNDTALMRYNTFPELISEYFKLYEVDDSIKNLQNKEYRKFVDFIYLKSKDNSNIRQNLMSFLLDGFEQMSLDSMALYVYDNYLNIEQCNENTNAGLAKRMEGLRKTSIGKPMNDIDIFDVESGKHLKLSNIEANFTLILFWSTKCSHCVKLYQQLQSLYELKNANANTRGNLKNFEIFAIALDTIKADYQNFILKNPGKWINACDFNGFNGELANKYSIYATPTMFLVDKQKKIVLKPTNFDRLKSFLDVAIGTFTND